MEGYSRRDRNPKAPVMDGSDSPLILRDALGAAFADEKDARSRFETAVLALFHLGPEVLEDAQNYYGVPSSKVTEVLRRYRKV